MFESTHSPPILHLLDDSSFEPENWQWCRVQLPMRKKLAQQSPKPEDRVMLQSNPKTSIGFQWFPSTRFFQTHQGVSEHWASMVQSNPIKVIYRSPNGWLSYHLSKLYPIKLQLIPFNTYGPLPLKVIFEAIKLTHWLRKRTYWNLIEPIPLCNHYPLIN